jgi:outer membrane protein assembly factor BamB
MKSILSLLTLWLGVHSLLAGENWPCFRGPTRQGISTEQSLPLHWNSTSNVIWRSSIPGAGWSSPIVWDKHVFLTTATDDGAVCRVLALDRETGRVLWDREVFRQLPRRKESRNSYASATPATDGKRVYTCFADGSFATLDFEGAILWTNRDYPHYSQHGLGSSILLHDDLVLMARDGSSDGENPKLGWQIPWDQARILALDQGSGQPRWVGRRGLSRIAHVTPNIHSQDGEAQLVSGAGDVVQGFDLKSGELLWTARSQGEGVVPSIVLGDNLAFTVSGFEKPTIRAVRLDGRGDVTDTHIAWEQTRGVPMIPSMLYLPPHLYSITTGGIAQCMSAETGEILWQERVGGNHSSSPVYADGHIYFASEEGDVTVIRAGPEFMPVARNPMGERIQASIAVSRGQLFIRTEQALYAIAR